jgi:hypothetical protein
MCPLKSNFFHCYQFRSKNPRIDLKFFVSLTNTLNKNSCFEANHLSVQFICEKRERTGKCIEIDNIFFNGKMYYEKMCEF